MGTQEQVISTMVARLDQEVTVAKDGLRELMRAGGSFAIFLHLQFLTRPVQGPTETLPAPTLQIIKQLALTSTLQLLSENNGEFCRELMDMSDGNSSW